MTPMPSTSSPPPGSVLVIAMILLAVLSIIGAAAVSLSSQERVNATAQTRVDFLNACANAAQAKIWAEMAQYGLSYLGHGVRLGHRPPERRSDRRAGPLRHLRRDDQASVKDVFFKVQSAGKGDEINERDCTNGVRPDLARPDVRDDRRVRRSRRPRVRGRARGEVRAVEDAAMRSPPPRRARAAAASLAVAGWPAR